MSRTRVNETIAIVGRRQTGKTTFTRHLAARQQQKVLVLDTFDHPSYRDYEILHPSRIKEWARSAPAGRYRITAGHPVDNLEQIFTNVFDTFLVLEDAAKYLDNDIPKRVRQGFIDHRNRGIDIAIMFHNLTDIAPYLVKMVNRLVMFRTNDNIEISLPKFYNWHEIKAKQQRIRELIDSGKKPAWYNETIIIQ